MDVKSQYKVFNWYSAAYSLCCCRFIKYLRKIVGHKKEGAG